MKIKLAGNKRKFKLGYTVITNPIQSVTKTDRWGGYIYVTLF